MSEMRVWTSGEEAYVAASVDDVLQYHRTEYGLSNGDFPPAEDWREQIGSITITFDNEMIDETLKANATEIVPAKHPGQTKITKVSTDWVKGFDKPGMLWSTNW
jgi:hypothetical protein